MNLKFYITNFILTILVVLSAYLMFTGQFKHDDLNNQISQIDKKIFAQKNQIAKLELKFSYLTSPGRIKKLSAKYLGDQEIITPRQVKDPQKLERYYLAKLKSLYGTNLAAIQDQEINLN